MSKVSYILFITLIKEDTHASENVTRLV